MGTPGCWPFRGVQQQRRQSPRTTAAVASMSAASADLLLAMPAAQQLRASGAASEALLLMQLRMVPALEGLSDGLEAPVQLLYLLTLLGFLVVGAFLVVRQV